MRRTYTKALLAGAVLLTSGAGTAQTTPPADAVVSDPVAMGWMQGTPPPPEKRILFSRGDHMTFPMTRYSFSHMREFLPTKRVYRRNGPVRPLPAALRQDIDGLTFVPIGGTQPMRWDQSLLANYTDGIIVLHKGKVVYERYFGSTTPETRHIAFSATKSFIGTLVETLIAEGRLDENKPVSHYLPELAASGFGDATLRQMLDMTDEVAFVENYTDPNSEVIAFSRSAGLRPRPAGYTGPTDLYSFLPTVAKGGEHGQRFTYRSCNTEVLSWIVARSEGKTLDQVLSERIWKPLDMESDAEFLIDSAGTPFTAAGLNPVLRDMARFGEAMRLGGKVGGRQVIPARVIDSVRQGGNREYFAKAGYKMLPGWSYRSQWWVSHNAHGAFSARGINGQVIYVDPRAEMVIARFASHPVAANSGSDAITLSAFQAMAEHLMRTGSK